MDSQHVFTIREKRQHASQWASSPMSEFSQPLDPTCTIELEGPSSQATVPVSKPFWDAHDIGDTVFITVSDSNP